MEGLVNLHSGIHHVGWLNNIFKVITYLGDIGLVWLFIAFILFWFKKTRKSAIVMVVSLAVGYVFNNLILKNLFDRARPFTENKEFEEFILSLKMELPDGSSFPSGHAFSSFLCATILTLFNKKMGWFTLPLALLIAFSRVYLCVHYPTDVLAGAVVGVAFAFACYYGFKFIDRKIEKIKKDKVRNKDAQN